MRIHSILVHGVVIPINLRSNSLSFEEGWGEACSVFIHQTAVSIVTTFIKA